MVGMWGLTIGRPRSLLGLEPGVTGSEQPLKCPQLHVTKDRHCILTLYLCIMFKMMGRSLQEVVQTFELRLEEYGGSNLFMVRQLVRVGSPTWDIHLLTSISWLISSQLMIPSCDSCHAKREILS